MTIALTPNRLDRAACQSTTVDFFDLNRPGPARALCSRCPVEQACLDYAITEDLTEGIWGGTTPTQRARLVAKSGVSR